jgi:hypothetical protein
MIASYLLADSTFIRLHFQKSLFGLVIDIGSTPLPWLRAPTSTNDDHPTIPLDSRVRKIKIKEETERVFAKKSSKRITSLHAIEIEG